MLVGSDTSNTPTTTTHQLQLTSTTSKVSSQITQKTMQTHQIRSSCCANVAQQRTATPLYKPTAQTHPSSQQNNWVGSVVCSGLVAVALQLSAGHSAALAAPPAVPITGGSSPYQEAKKLVYGPTDDGRVRSCPTNINPNCVSTGSTNDAYSPAWFAPSATPAAAADELERAVLASVDGADVLQSLTLPSGAEYRAFGAPSAFGQDVLEFILRPEQPSGQLVTYRSMAGSVRYIWPIQQPIGDLGVQRKRLNSIRSNLTASGWRALGCELIECYQ